jgi:hypothetical protein
MIKDYNVSLRVEFMWDEEKTNPFYWINPETNKAQWRLDGIYSDIKDEDDVWRHLAYNAIVNGVVDASRLDGWGDLHRGELTMRVFSVLVEDEL